MVILKIKNSAISNPQDFENLNLSKDEVLYLKSVLTSLFQEDFKVAERKIKRLQNKIESLESDLSPLGLPLYLALESILQDNRAFYEPGTATFKLKDGKFSKDLNIDPRDLICVFTHEKGRKKAFIVREEVNSRSRQSREIYKQYELNSNDLNYEEIKKMIDPISSRFVQIAKSTLVNVAYYRFDNKNELIFERELVTQENFSRFTITMKGAIDLLELIKMHWQENYSLQKRITDYMKSETGTGRP